MSRPIAALCLMSVCRPLSAKFLVSVSRPMAALCQCQPGHCESSVWYQCQGQWQPCVRVNQAIVSQVFLVSVSRPMAALCQCQPGHCQSSVWYKCPGQCQPWIWCHCPSHYQSNVWYKCQGHWQPGVSVQAIISQLVSGIGCQASLCPGSCQSSVISVQAKVVASCLVSVKSV